MKLATTSSYWLTHLHKKGIFLKPILTPLHGQTVFHFITRNRNITDFRNHNTNNNSTHSREKMPPKIRPKTAPIDPTQSNPKTTPPPVASLQTNETNNQTHVAPKKKTVKKVVKIIVKKLVKKRVPKASLNRKREVLENQGNDGTENGFRGIDGIGEMDCVENCVGGNGLAENDEKIDSLVLNSSFGGGCCDFEGNARNLNEECKLGVIEGFEREERNELAESVGKIESSVSNSGFGGESCEFGGNLNNEGTFGVTKDSVGHGSCDFGGNFDKGGRAEEGKNLVEAVGKIGSLASDSVINEGVEVNVHGSGSLGQMEAGKISWNSIPEADSCDVDVSMLEEGIPAEIESFGGMEAKTVEGSGNVDSLESDLVVENKFCDPDVMEVENEGTLGISEKEGSASGDQVNGEEDQSTIVKSEFAGEKSIENEGLVEGRSDEFKNEVQVERLKEDGEKEEVDKSNGATTSNVGSASSAELDVNEKLQRKNTEIFIGGVEKSATKEDVRKVFEEIGEIIEVRMQINERTQKNKGYAFVRFASAADAKKALEKHPKVEICGKQCSTAPLEGNTVSLGNFNKKWKNDGVKTVYVHYLPPSWNEEKVRNYFKRFGEIENVVLPRNLHSSRRRDFAFVEFVTREAALACIESFNHRIVDDEGAEVNVKVAIAKTLPKGKSLKKVSTSTSQEISKQKLKAVERTAKRTQSRNKEASTAAHTKKTVAKAERMRPIEHGNKRGHSNYNNSDRANDMRIRDAPVDARTSHGVVDARTLHSTDLEQILAERALHRQIRSRLGLTNSNHSSVSPGTKRSFAASTGDLYNTESIRHTRLRVENSFPFRSENMAVDDPYHLVPRVHTHVHAESSFPPVNRSLQADYLYHPDARGNIRVHAENSFSIRNPNMHGDDLFHPDHRMYPRVGVETESDDPYRHDPRGHVLVHGEKSFLGRSPNFQADDLLPLAPLRFSNVHSEHTLPRGSLGHSEAPPGFGALFPYRRQSPDFASASDYRAKDYTDSFQEAPIAGSISSLQKTWKK